LTSASMSKGQIPPVRRGRHQRTTRSDPEGAIASAGGMVARRHKVWRRGAEPNSNGYSSSKLAPDFAVFELLRKQSELPSCTRFTTCKCPRSCWGRPCVENGPARTRTGRSPASLRSLSTNRKAQKQLGFEGRNENWIHLIRKVGAGRSASKSLAPALVPDGPNPEYPWPETRPRWHPPSTRSPYGRSYKARRGEAVSSSDQPTLRGSRFLFVS